MKKLLKKLLFGILKNSHLKNYIIMESRPNFSDNTKRIFDYLIEKNINENYKIIWIMFNDNEISGIEIPNVRLVKNSNKLLKLYYIMHAKYIINCNRDIPKINKKTIAINLWHGTLLKSLANLKLITDEYIDYCLCPSEFYKDIYERELHISKDKLVIMNNPRNDYLFSERCNLEEFFGKKYSKYIIWMPTFRQAKGRSDSDYNFNKGIPILQTEDDIKRINCFLKENNTLLVIKPHFAQDMSVFKVTELSNVKIVHSNDLIKSQIELYEFIGRFDALITDYSSVYFDFLVKNKPIGFTIDDMENYANNKGFVFDNVTDYMPGMKISNINQMEIFIENLKNNIDEYEKERIRICNLVNTYKDNKNAERVVEFLKI